MLLLFGFEDDELDVDPFVSLLFFLWCFLCFLVVVPESVLVLELPDWPD